MALRGQAIILADVPSYDYIAESVRQEQFDANLLLLNTVFMISFFLAPRHRDVALERPIDRLIVSWEVSPSIVSCERSAGIPVPAQHRRWALGKRSHLRLRPLVS